MTAPPPPINPVVILQPLATTAVAQDTSQNPILAAAKHGQVIEGFVVNRDAQQNPILRTPQGDILVKSDVFLKTGAQIQIRVDAQLASRARIILVDGQSLENYAKQTQHPLQKADVILPSSLLMPAREGMLTNAMNTLAQALRLPAVILRQQEQPVNRTAEKSGGKNATAPLNNTPASSTEKAPLSNTTGLPRSTPLPPAGSAVTVTIVAASLPNETHDPVEAAIRIAARADSAPPRMQPTASTQAATPAAMASVATTIREAASASAPTPTPSPIMVSTAENAHRPNAVGTPPPPPTASMASAPPATTYAQPIENSDTPETLPAISATNAHKAEPAHETPSLATVRTETSELLALRTKQAPMPNEKMHLAPTHTAPATLADNTNTADADAMELLMRATSTLPQKEPAALRYAPLAAQAMAENDSAALPPATHKTYGSIQSAGPSDPPTIMTAPANLSNARSTAEPDPFTHTMTVIGHDGDGGTIVKNETVTLKVFTAQPLPSGSVLHVRIAPQAIPPADAMLLPSRLVEFSNIFTHWPAMEDVTQLLMREQVLPENATPNLVRLAPHVGPELTRDLLFFISALRTGDIRNFWPKAIVETVESKHPNIFQRIQSDMASLSQLASPPPNQPWSAFMIPMLFEQQLQHIRLFVRDDTHQGATEEAIHNQRFIMELSLSHLSDMQLDGFVQGAGKPTQFDLVIRSEKTLPEDVEDEISRLFTHALSLTKLRGNIHFQAGREHFVIPETLSNQMHATTNTHDYTLLA